MGNDVQIGIETTIEYLTDQFNAEAFVRDHGDDVRFVFAWKRWLMWSGKNWQADRTGLAMQLGKESVRRLSAIIPTIEDGEACNKFVRHIMYSWSVRGLNAMLTSAVPSQASRLYPSTSTQSGF